MKGSSPERFAGGCRLPQSPGAGIEGSIEELRFCVEGLLFVGYNQNPDPSDGSWSVPALTNRYRYPGSPVTIGSVST